MRVLKYRDVTRLTFYGRYDKNINDATSIYAGFDRALATTTGGGINSISITSLYPNTYLFTASPNVIIANASSYNNTLTSQTLSNYYCKTTTITTAGNYTTGTPTVYLSDTNLGMTITAIQLAGYITGFTVTNPGNILFSSAPTVLLSGGGGSGGYCVSSN